MSDVQLGVQIIPSLTEGDIQVIPVGDVKIPFTKENAAGLGLPDPVLRGLFHDWTKRVGEERWCTQVFYTTEDQLGHESGVVLSDNNEPMGTNERAWLHTEATRAEVVDFHKEPTIVNRAMWDNSGNDQPITGHATISDQTARTVSREWHKDYSLGTSITVGLEVGSEAVGAKSKFETTETFSTDWGTGGSQSEQVNVGSEAAVEVPVPANTIKVAALIAFTGHITVRLHTESTISGALGFSLVEHKHHKEWWSAGDHYPNIWVNIEDIVSSGSLNRASYVDWKYQFYGDAHIVVKEVPAPTDKAIQAVFLGDLHA